MMDGLELLKEVRRRDSEAVVIMTTAFGCEDYTIQALRLGAQDYLKKPVRHDQLAQVLKKYYRLLQDRSAEENVLAMVVRRECILEFENDLLLVGKISDYLVRVEYSMDGHGAEWSIFDEGEGFDWKSLPDPRAPENLFSAHGRGIFLCRMQFDQVEFRGCGNIVRARKDFSPLRISP